MGVVGLYCSGIEITKCVYIYMYIYLSKTVLFAVYHFFGTITPTCGS